MKNQALLRITNCIDCPYVDCQCEDADGYSDVYCARMNEFLGEYETKKILYSSDGVPVPDNYPLLNKN